MTAEIIRTIKSILLCVIARKFEKFSWQSIILNHLKDSIVEIIFARVFRSTIATTTLIFLGVEFVAKV